MYTASFQSAAPAYDCASGIVAGACQRMVFGASRCTSAWAWAPASPPKNKNCLAVRHRARGHAWRRDVWTGRPSAAREVVNVDVVEWPAATAAADGEDPARRSRRCVAIAHHYQRRPRHEQRCFTSPGFCGWWLGRRSCGLTCTQHDQPGTRLDSFDHESWTGLGVLRFV